MAIIRYGADLSVRCDTGFTFFAGDIKDAC